MLGLRQMASAAGKLEPISNHLKGVFLVLQVFHNDAKVLRHRLHLSVNALLQFPFPLLKHRGSHT